MARFLKKKARVLYTAKYFGEQKILQEMRRDKKTKGRKSFKQINHKNINLPSKDNSRNG